MAFDSADWKQSAESCTTNKNLTKDKTVDSERVIDFDEMFTAMTAVVEEAGPSFVYPRRPTRHACNTKCVYVYEGNPDCLIGKVLVKLGFTVDDLIDLHNHRASVSFKLGVFKNFTESALRSMDIAQRAQDEGLPWDRCLMIAAMNKDQVVYW